MTKMKAAVLVEPHRFEIELRDKPLCRADEVLIKIERTGICGTDIHIFNGHYAADRLPLVPGHEFVGTIEDIGLVKKLEVSQRVVVDINVGCGTCYWCRRNEILNCPDMAQLGVTRDGAFAEYLAVPSRLVIAVPKAMKVEDCALVEPVSCVVRSARKSQIRFGSSVVILGAGPIGNLHVQLMRMIGAAPIVVSDISEERCRMAKAVGADVAESDPARLRSTVLELTDGRGADMVIESVGNLKLYEEAFRLIRKGGHVAFFGLAGSDVKLPISILETILQENSLKGSVAGMGEDMHDALTLLRHGRFDTKPFTSATYALEDIQSAFETLPGRPEHLKTQIAMQ